MRSTSRKTTLTSRKTVALLALVTLVTAGLTLAATSWARPTAPASPLGLPAGGSAPVGSGAIAERVLEHVADRLELTDPQRDEIRRSVLEHGPEIVLALRDVKASRIELFRSIHEHPPFEDDIRAASAELAVAQTRLALLRAQLAHEIHGVLTPSQQDELAEMKENLLAFLDLATDVVATGLAAAS